MGSETVRNVGIEADVVTVQALTPQQISDDTPVLSSAIDTSSVSNRRTRILLVAAAHEATATAHTMAFTVTESATSGGAYTAATTTGTLTASSATDVVRTASIKRNKAKPFIKITATGSHADADFIVSATVLFLGGAV